MTDLLDRYLAAIERRLPRETASDIVAELREVLTARIEAKETETGRPVTDDEITVLLKAYGHPVMVASRYAGHDYLIGPNYYPWFWHVQRIAIGLTIAIGFGVITLRSLGSEEPFTAAFRGFGGAFQAALIAFGVVTALFVGAERTKLDMKWADRWNPKALPRDNVREPKSLVESAFTLVFDVIFLLWWVKVVQFPNEIPIRGNGAAAVTFSPAWEMVYWPILLLIAGATVVHLFDLLRPAWSRTRAMVTIAGHVAGAAILWVLYRAQPLVEVTGVRGADPEAVERTARIVEGIVTLSIGLTGLVWAVAIGMEVWRLWRSMRPAGALPA